MEYNSDLSQWQKGTIPRPEQMHLEVWASSWPSSIFFLSKELGNSREAYAYFWSLLRTIAMEYI